MRRGGLLFAFLWIWSFTPLCAAEPNPIGWRHDFEQAQADAQRLNRPLLVHFHAEWCGPCRRMERDIFRAPEFLQQLDGRLIAVKVDADQRPDLTERFNVRGLPTDLFLDPSGRVVAQSTGYVDRDRYLGQMARIDARFNTTGRTLVAKSQTAVPTAPAVERTVKPADEPPTAAPAEPALVGLGGFSPISLWNWREWRKGSPEFAAEHQRVTFYMATADELRQFQENPEQYVPKLLGCDPVLMAETDRAVPGSTKFGAYFDGELYLFTSLETRARFKQSPLRFTRTRHVLRVDEIERTQLH